MKILLQQYYLHKELISNLIWRSLQVFGKQGITFLIFILCAKFLTPYEFGIYNYILAVVFFLIMFGDFGISTSVSKFVVEYTLTDKEKLKGLLFNSIVLICGLSTLIVFLSVIFGSFYLKGNYVFLLYILPIVWFAPLTSLYDGIYRGLKKFKSLALISLSVGGISIPFVYILIKQYGLVGALISQSCFYLILFLILALGYREFHISLKPAVIKEVGKYSLVLGIENLGMLFQTRIDILVLGAFNMIIPISYYEFSNKIFSILVLPFLIFSQIVAPDISHYFVLKNKTLIITKLKSYLSYSFLFAIIVSIITFLLTKMSIPKFFPEYNEKLFYTFIAVFLIIFPIRVAGTILVNSFIITTNSAMFLMYNNLFFGVLNLILDIIFIKYFGPVGVVHATLLISYISGIMIFCFYLNRLKRNVVT